MKPLISHCRSPRRGEPPRSAHHSSDVARAAWLTSFSPWRPAPFLRIPPVAEGAGRDLRSPRARRRAGAAQRPAPAGRADADPRPVTGHSGGAVFTDTPADGGHVDPPGRRHAPGHLLAMGGGAMAGGSPPPARQHRGGGAAGGPVGGPQPARPHLRRLAGHGDADGDSRGHGPARPVGRWDAARSRWAGTCIRTTGETGTPPRRHRARSLAGWPPGSGGAGRGAS